MSAFHLIPRTIPILLLAAGAAHGQETAHRHAGGGLGTVHFVTSCRADVAPDMNRAVALLHSFEFGAALQGFDAVLAADSTCAMAQWGRALALWSNPMSAAIRPPAQLARGRDAAERATRLAARATPRERGYVEAVSALYAEYEHVAQPDRVVAYERAMAALVAREPADTEARIFHAIALVASAPPTDKSYARQLRAGAVLESLWTAQPDHPGLAHYIIHAYDVPALAPRAEDAALRYATIAPAAAHALHMPSHTFTRLGRWEESVESNRRSADAALRDASIAEVLHASDYMEYAWLQLGRLDSARAVLDRLPALAARFDPAAVTGAAPGTAGTFALAAIPARYALERGAWAEAAALPVASSGVAWADAVTWFARAVGGARSGRAAVAREAVDSLGALRDRLSGKGEAYWTEQVAIQRLGAEAWLELARGNRDVALARMREAAAREEATEKSPVTPGPLAPAREMLGDMLLELGRPTDARDAYRAALAREPGRRRALEGVSAASADAQGRKRSD